MFQNRGSLAYTNSETSLCDPGQAIHGYSAQLFKGLVLKMVRSLRARTLPIPAQSSLVLDSLPVLQACWPLTFCGPGASLPPGRCTWGHFPHLTSPREGRRRPPGPAPAPGRVGGEGRAGGAATARDPPALSPLGPEWQSGARTIRIASRRPAPRRPLIGCRSALGARASPRGRPDRAVAGSGVGGERPGVTPDVVTSWCSHAEVGGRGGGGAGAGPPSVRPRPFPVSRAGLVLRACQPSPELPASPPAQHCLCTGAARHRRTPDASGPRTPPP